MIGLSREVDRSEGIRLGREVTRRLVEGLVGVEWDDSTHRGEQPCYLPLHGAETMRWAGEPVDVDALLAEAPPVNERPSTTERAERIKSDDPVVQRLDELGMVKDDRAASVGKLIIVCPFEAEHSEPGGESATVYFLPNFGGVRYGKFKCLHAHCAERRQEDFILALGLEPKEAWRAQAVGPAPYDDLPPVDSYGEEGARAKPPPGGEPGTERPSNGSNGSASSPGFQKLEFSEARPIQAPLWPVPAFPEQVLLPDALRAWIMDESWRMPCQTDFIAAAALVSLGAVIGARCAIKPKPKDDWLVVPNLWGGIVGPPSAKKSPAITAATKPLGRLVAKAVEAHKADMEDFEAKKVVFHAKKEAIEARIKAVAKNSRKGSLDSLAMELQGHRKEPPVEPILHRYKTNDTTVEKLGELLRDNPTGLLVLRDELVGLLASWEREGHESDRAFYLEGWNGTEGYDTDRIKRGSILIPNHCVSVFGGIQPDKLTAYLEQATHALANDGMLQRFQLLVYPDPCPWEWRDRFPNKIARDRAFDVFEALADFDPVAWGAGPADNFNKFPHFRFDDAAQEIFIEWDTDLHRSKLPAEEDPLIAQHLAKFDKLMPALALILHLVECAATGQRGPVTKEAALRAAAWCEYLETHTRRCYGLLTDDGLRSAQALADKVRQGSLADGFTARDVRRNQWRYLTTEEAVQVALGWLEDEGWLRSEATGGVGPGSGRRTIHYAVNPKVNQ
ncbi:MAG: YfjI family protein [Gammaproteobacteria bacterium]